MSDKTTEVDTDVKLSKEEIQKSIDILLDAQDRHLDNPEWYQTCLVCAFSKTSDVEDAILIADTMYDMGQPEINSEDEESEQGELLRLIEGLSSDLPSESDETESSALSVDEHGMEHAPKGTPKGGQFTGKKKVKKVKEVSREDSDKYKKKLKYSTIGHFTGTSVYRLTDKVAKLKKLFKKKYTKVKDKNVAEGIWPVLSGQKPMGFLDSVNASKANKSRIASSMKGLIKKFFKSGDIEVKKVKDPRYPGNSFMVVINKKAVERKGLNKEDKDKLIKYWTKKRKNPETVEELEQDDKMQELTGKWLGFPLRSIGAFIRNLGGSSTLSVDEHGLQHAPAGSSKGGQFVSKNEGGRRDTTKSKRGKDKEKGSTTAAVKGTVTGAIRGAIKGFREGISSKPIYVGKKEHDLVIKKALGKYEINPPPSNQDKEEAKAGIEKLGAWGYRRNLVGNTKDRRSRREKLLKDFGDGETCPCIYCGIVVTHGTLEQDKMYTTQEGGRYKYSNVVPSCGDCNKRRGNMSFEQAMNKVSKYSGQIRSKS